MLKGLSHDLPRIWREFTAQYGIDGSTLGVIAELQKFESIRYPDEIVKQGLSTQIGRGKPSPPSGPPDPRQRAARNRVLRQRHVRGGKVPARGIRRGAGRFHVARGRLSTNQAAAVSPGGPYILLRHRLKVRNYRRNHVASNAVVNGKPMMEETTMYRKLVTLICAMLLSTAAFGQGGGGSGGGAGGAAGGGAAGGAGAGGGGTGATGGSTTGTGVNPTAPGSQYTNPTTGLPYSPSNSNDPNNPNNPNNPMSNPRPPGSR